MAEQRIRVAISLGDPNGIGPEVVLKALSDADLHQRVRPILVGPREALEAFPGLYNAAEQAAGGALAVVHVASYRPVHGLLSAESGNVSMVAVDAAVDLCLTGQADAVVTAPISKEAIHLGGWDFPGHTEFIAGKCSGSSFCMMMVSGGFRVALVTAHVPLREVAHEVTTAAILGKLAVVGAALKTDHGIAHPKIAVLGLNPHAGDGGILGDEETTVLRPALDAAAGMDVTLEGPFAADAFFGRKAHLRYDAVLAMYHDQGLIPFKSLTFGRGVNVTAGLPIVRTSPDHGTAFDIAGQGVANAMSMRSAIDEACIIARNRALEPVRHAR
ncbi:MAG: 4-hydroxythreonine-4-phosphate dehydrogenase PdxA [Rhodothermales bacterium]